MAREVPTRSACHRCFPLQIKDSPLLLTPLCSISFTRLNTIFLVMKYPPPPFAQGNESYKQQLRVNSAAHNRFSQSTQSHWPHLRPFRTSWFAAKGWILGKCCFNPCRTRTGMPASQLAPLPVSSGAFQNRSSTRRV